MSAGGGGRDGDGSRGARRPSLAASDDAPLLIAPPLDLHAPVESSFREAIAQALVADEDATGTHARGGGRSEAKTVQDIDDDVELLEDEGDRTRFVHLDRDPTTEATVVGENRLVLLQLLRSIGPVERAPTSLDGRPSKESILLGRERALRFRVALLDQWDAERGERQAGPVSGVASTPSRPYALDALLQAALLVAFVHDPEPDPERLVGAHDAMVFGALLHSIRDLWPALPRATVRDAGAAACARVSVLGPARALDMLRSLAGDLDDDSAAATSMLVHQIRDVLGESTTDMAGLVLGALRR